MLNVFSPLLSRGSIRKTSLLYKGRGKVCDSAYILPPRSHLWDYTGYVVGAECAPTYNYSLQVYCLDHRSYIRHHCPTANKNDVTVVICPLCAKGVRLDPDEDPNITWESHVNTECDPSNYEKATKKKKCPVPRCKELLTFSNTIKCRDCTVDHCLKHRFGPDHNCPGPKKPEATFQFMNFLNGSKEEPKKA